MTEKGQNIFDVTLSNYGTIEELFRLLTDNGMTVSSEPSGGLNLIVFPEFKKETFFKEESVPTFIPEFIEEYVSDKQTIFDVAVQWFGDIEYLFDFLEANSLSADSLVKSGQKVRLYNINKGNNAVKNLNLRPANLTEIPLSGWLFIDGSAFFFKDGSRAEFIA